MRQPSSSFACQPSYDRALAAYRAADNETCLQYLSDLDHAKPTILRVRALTRLGRLSDAHDAVLEASLADAGDIERAEMNVIYANVAFKLQRSDVLETFEDARLSIEAVDSLNLRAELDFIRARYAWTNGDLDTADRYAGASAAMGADDATSVPRREHIRAFSIDLQGLLAQDRERFDLAAARSRLALDEYHAAALPDAWIAAYCTANLAILVRDFPSTTSSDNLEAFIDRVPWAQETASQRFFALHGLGWARGHEHDYERAMRAFDAAAEIAPMPALKCMAWVDRAALSRTVGLGRATELILNAAASAETISWESVHGQDRLVLLFAAEIIASIDPSRARRLITRYESTRTAEHRVATGAPGSRNVRWRCFEMHAEATVLRGEGFMVRATALLREEYEAWKRIGSTHRAAVAEYDLKCIGAGK